MHKRLSDDIKSVSETVHSICPDLSSQSICDCTRIGKYSEERTRPVVARLTRVQDVYKILANRHKLPRSPNNVKSYVSIKPFMTKTERLTESTLLKERRALIESGTDRRDIKIRGNSLYVNNRKFGTANELNFSPLSNASESVNCPDTEKQDVNPDSEQES